MVESRQKEAEGSTFQISSADQQDEGGPPATFPESVNAPLMASLNLANVFLDPDIGKSFTMSKVQIEEEYKEQES